MSALTDYLSQERADRYILVEVRDTNGIRQYSWSNKPYRINVAEDQVTANYLPHIEDDGFPSLRRECQTPTSGGSAIGFGSIRVAKIDPNNPPKRGWQISVWVTGPRRLFPYADRIPVVEGIVQRVIADDGGGIEIEIGSSIALALESEVRQQTYTLTDIGGIGTERAYDNQPLPLGYVRNMQPVLSDAANLKYDICAWPDPNDDYAGFLAGDVTAVYDSGVEIPGANWSVVIESETVESTGWKVARLVLTTTPIGIVTLDTTGFRVPDLAPIPGAPVVAENVAAIVTFLLMEFCGLQQSDITQVGQYFRETPPHIPLYNPFTEPAGYLVQGAESAREIIHKLITGAGGMWWITRNGGFYTARTIHYNEPVTFSLEVAAPKRQRFTHARWEEEGSPASQVLIQYDPNWTPMEPASGVALEDRHRFQDEGVLMAVGIQQAAADAAPEPQVLISHFRDAFGAQISASLFGRHRRTQRYQVTTEVPFQNLDLGMTIRLEDSQCPIEKAVVHAIEDSYNGIPVHILTLRGIDV